MIKSDKLNVSLCKFQEDINSPPAIIKYLKKKKTLSLYTCYALKISEIKFFAQFARLSKYHTLSYLHIYIIFTQY